MNKNLLIVGLTVMVNLLFAQSNGAKPSENGNETKVKQIPWQMISSSDEGVPTSSFRIKKVNDTAKKPELKNPIGDPIGLPLDYLDNDSEKIELKPNVKASFPGGETQFQKYVQSEIQYPISCHDQGVNEIVVLRFIVDSRGKISDIKVIEEAKTCPEFTTEAIRILQRSPRWVPGQVNGRFIRSLREINLEISNFKRVVPKNQVGDPIDLTIDYLDNDSAQTEIKPNVRASFPGGEAKFREYVQSEIQYPISCHNQRINGIVVLRFIVDSKGKISDIKVIEEVKTCPEFTTEAIRILQKSPRWVPGQLNGRFIRSLREINLDISNFKSVVPKNQVGEPFPSESNGGDGPYIESHSAEPIANPEIQARFPGGENMFYKYLSNSLVFPARCMDDGISGTVKLRFVVNVQGNISDIKVLEENKSCPEFTKEAIRVIRQSPKWIPAQIKGKFVNSRMMIPVRFNLE